MTVLAWGRCVVTLGAVLLLAGCSPPSFPDPPPRAGQWHVPAPPAAEQVQPSPPNADSPDFVTIDPIGLGFTPGTDPKRLAAWATGYCERHGLSPCTAIPDRGVALCIERMDCHPALLVPFNEGTAAFVFGGRFTMPVVYAVWLSEQDPLLAPFGSTRELLESYLLTLGVCPDQGGGYPRGPRCPPEEQTGGTP
ncbi:hypothetical protein [Microbacterium ureisolvens]|uniref:Lipoprotein n=1 Tax=Microbacterium ureisolvens TaxID=2781186 RepID=A0ABS7HTW3_9MICO|nr:hypothetical protein [Microbacterium ureisolvens]MBW9108245.1 hypothetical protein [Microbacterium ureisolvens]